MNAFLSGSQVYGSPGLDSDIDLVVSMTGDEMHFLAGLATVLKLPVDERESCSQSGPCSISIRFGKLNLIACSTLSEFTLWKKGTDLLRQVKPVTREHAMDVFRRLRIEGDCDL